MRKWPLVSVAGRRRPEDLCLSRGYALDMAHRIFTTPFSNVYVLYIKKLARKHRTEDELLDVTQWLTGMSRERISELVEQKTTFEDFFAQAQIHPNASLITGSICGVKVQDIEDPLMQKIRYLDKLVDELYKGKSIEKVIRS